MIGKTRPFNPASHKENDEKGRMYAKWLFKMVYNIDAIDNKNTKGVDLILYKEKEHYGYADPEIRLVLNNFKFNTLHIPERKEKILEFPDKKPVFLCAFSPDGDVCYMTRGSYLLTMKPIEVKNKSIEEGEYFYDVPLELVRKLYWPYYNEDHYWGRLL